MMTDIQALCPTPERTVIGHPFNPPYLLPLVEIVGGKNTSPEAVIWAREAEDGRHWQRTSGDDDTLAWQMIRERFACGAFALERLDRLCPGCRRLGRQLVHGRRRLQVFQLQFNLIEQPGLALRPAAKNEIPISTGKSAPFLTSV